MNSRLSGILGSGLISLSLLITGAVCAAEQDLFTLLSANVNLMPPGKMSKATVGNPRERAKEIAKLFVRQHPDADVIAVQEFYDTDAAQIIIDSLQRYGYTYYPGPNRNDYGKEYDSGQGVFVRNELIKAGYVFAFEDYGVLAGGILEANAPKGFNVIRVSRASDPQHSIHIIATHLQAQFPSQFDAGYELLSTLSNSISNLQFDQVGMNRTIDLLAPWNIRRVQLETIKRHIDENGLHNQNVVVIGDMNLLGDHRSWNPGDIWRKVASSDKTEFAQMLELLDLVPAKDIGFPTMCANDNNTYGLTKAGYRSICYMIGNHGQLDHALVNREMSPAVESYDRIRLIHNYNDSPPQWREQSLSDHDGIQVRIRWDDIPIRNDR